MSAQVPESGFDYQLDDGGLIPETNQQKKYKVNASNASNISELSEVEIWPHAKFTVLSRQKV